MTHDNHEREANEGKVWELYDAGMAEQVIAFELGISIDLVESIIGADPDEYPEEQEEPEDHFRDDVEADADTLASAGWGTNEDYVDYGDDGGDW